MQERDAATADLRVTSPSKQEVVKCDVIICCSRVCRNDATRRSSSDVECELRVEKDTAASLASLWQRSTRQAPPRRIATLKIIFTQDERCSYLDERNSSLPGEFHYDRK